MHELRVAKNIVDLVLESFPDSNEPVEKVTVHIGELNNIIDESLIFYFDVIAKEYLHLQNAKLDIVKIPINTLCSACGKKKMTREPVFVCDCGKFLQIISGEELILESCTIGENFGN